MTTYQHPTTGHTKSARSEPVQAFLESRGYLPVATAEEAGEIKGADLEAALDAADLPKTGTADEKRARLAEHAAAQLDPTDPTQGQ